MCLRLRGESNASMGTTLAVAVAVAMTVALLYLRQSLQCFFLLLTGFFFI